MIQCWMEEIKEHLSKICLEYMRWKSSTELNDKSKIEILELKTCQK